MIGALNDCFAAECRSLIGHLADSQPFISWVAVDEQAVVRRIIADERRHERELADLIDALDGVAVPVTPPTNAASIHYLDLLYLLSQIIADKRRLVAAYEMACARVAGEERAEKLVSRILDDERRHLADLERIARSNAPAAAPTA